MQQWLASKNISIVYDHYTGFEGHPEYQFVSVCQTEAKIFRMWSGWFDAIMDKITPKDTAWISLALVYHLEQGWFEASPWKLEEVELAITQLQEACAQFHTGERKRICRNLIDFLLSEYKKGGEIFIHYD